MISADDTDDVAVGVDNRKNVLSARPFAWNDEFTRLGDGQVRWKRNHTCAHHFTDKQDLQRIESVFAAKMITAPGDLFGENGAFQQQNGKCMGKKACYEQRQKHVEIMR